MALISLITYRGATVLPDGMPGDTGPSQACTGKEGMQPYKG